MGISRDDINVHAKEELQAHVHIASVYVQRDLCLTHGPLLNQRKKRSMNICNV